MAFVEKAIAHNLLIIPGSVFSERNTHFRISYAAPDATIAKGLEVLGKIVAEGPAA
jgi:aspartate aminotransferase/aminotransferase